MQPASQWTPETTPLCVTRCMNLAELTVDGEPYCVDCADALLDRVQAMEIRPELRDVLPPLGRHEPVRLRALPAEAAEGSEEMKRLEELWEREATPAEKAAVAAVRAREESRVGRPPHHGSMQRVTPVELHEPEAARPAGQLSLLAGEA